METDPSHTVLLETRASRHFRARGNAAIAGRQFGATSLWDWMKEQGTMSSQRRIAFVLTNLVVASLCACRPVYGVPILQLYIEGATYDWATETWTHTVLPGADGAVNLRLWVIGNPNPRGPIYDVRVSVAYPSFLRSTQGDLLLTWTPSTTGGFGGFYDPSVPPPVSFVQYGAAGTSPLIVGSSRLPTHGVFGPETVWQEFRLGTFALKDSPLGDFYGSFPTPTQQCGQINVYDISIRHTGGMPLDYIPIHFDAYGYVLRNKRRLPVFAPFSHDAEIQVVPAPPSLVLLASGGVCLAGWLAQRTVRRRRSRLASS